MGSENTSKDEIVESGQTPTREERKADCLVDVKRRHGWVCYQGTGWYVTVPTLLCKLPHKQLRFLLVSA